MGFTESEASKFSVDGTRLHFPKLGTVRIVLHTPIVGKPKRCTLRREAGGEWYASILLETEVDEPAAREEPMVAIDRGVVLLLADSDGRIVENPKHLEQTAKVLARAQRIVARRKKGSKNREKAKLRVAKLHAKVSRQREYALHQVSSEYARDYGTVVLEKLKVANMTRSAKGTVEEPGKNVRAKAGLNRAILGAAWGKFGEMLRYKMAWAGGRVVEVPAAYSSQTCSSCGHVDAASRVTQAEFRCTSCGHEANADLNAAMVLKARGLRAVEAPAAAVKDVVRLRKVRVLTRKAA